MNISSHDTNKWCIDLKKKAETIIFLFVILRDKKDSPIGKTLHFVRVKSKKLNLKNFFNVSKNVESFFFCAWTCLVISCWRSKKKKKRFSSIPEKGGRKDRKRVLMRRPNFFATRVYPSHALYKGCTKNQELFFFSYPRTQPKLT